MNLKIKFLLTIMAFVLIGAVASIHAQTSEQPAGVAQPNSFSGDPVRQLNLTPEQLEQIRTIREQNRDERAAINQRVREAHRLLDATLDSDAPDQSLVEQRINEVSAAQAAAMRMRITTEVRIRQVLTIEQRTMLKSMRRQALELREGRGTQKRQRRLEQRSLRLQERRTRIRPQRTENPSQRPQEW